MVYEDLKEYKTAIELMEEAIKIVKETCKADDNIVKIVMNIYERIKLAAN